MIVVPAIIPYTKKQLEDEINKVAGFARLVQIDISDGIFTPTKTWPYNGKDRDFFESLKKEEVGRSDSLGTENSGRTSKSLQTRTSWPQWQDLEFEIHLMVKSPENIVLDWINTSPSTIVAHIEATDNFQKVIDICRMRGVKIGLAIKPSTDISCIKPFVSGVDFIQVMGNDLLGKHGVPLDPKAIDVVKSLQKLYPERIIAIDIGVTEETEAVLI